MKSTQHSKLIDGKWGFDFSSSPKLTFGAFYQVSYLSLIHISLSETMNAAISLNAATPNADGFLMMKSNYSVDLRFDKSFANRTWIIYLSANDIFKTTKERWTMYGQGSGTMKDCYNYTRSISLQVTYNFNAKRSKYKGTGAGNEEKSRL